MREIGLQSGAQDMLLREDLMDSISCVEGKLRSTLGVGLISRAVSWCVMN